jgi:predicted deacylase
MRRTLVAALAVLSVSAAAPAVADPQSTPNGPWPGENPPNIAALRSYEQLWSTLEAIEGRAQGAFELTSAPLTSNTGRDIPVVTIGDGPTGLMIIAQQHGNEYVVSEAMIELIRDLSGNSASDRAIRDALTVAIVPRVNVDGFDADVQDIFGNTPPWRQNYDPSCTVSPCDPFYARGRGYDINRYHSYTSNPFDHPYLPGDDNLNPVPESIAMRLLYEQYQPEIVIDFHHQGSYVDADGQLITGSTMWPNAVDTAAELGILPEFEQAITLSKQVVSTMVTELSQYGYANITRYPGTETPGIARNAYGLLGSGSVLFEMRGGIYTQSNGYITKTAYQAAKAVVEAAADGSLFTASTAPADNLPDRGPGIGDPTPEGPEE